jgi:hypothetical protein
MAVEKGSGLKRKKERGKVDVVIHKKTPRKKTKEGGVFCLKNISFASLQGSLGRSLTGHVSGLIC